MEAHLSDEINESEQQRSKKVAHLDDAHVHLLPPSIKGFHLKHKIWGEFAITRLRDIEWNNMAFKHLVISDTYRNVVQSLCDVHTGTLGAGLVKDVVPGKGEGVIMAFHGRPGTGKTLTAEAVAEHLKTPLYMVSAGELGTAALERNLQNVLRLATAWKAVLLIDEADIFLQRRSSTDLERNAVVGTFLRLLEYYNGVLIITTNRMHDMDEAFASRFSLILPFEDLSAASRRQIWEGVSWRSGEGAELTTVREALSTRARGRGRRVRSGRARRSERERARHQADGAHGAGARRVGGRGPANGASAPGASPD